MSARQLVIAVAVVLSAVSATAQTQSELLEQAIFADETAGDMVTAIRLYEQLISTPDVDLRFASMARSRVADLRRRRDLAAATAAAAQQSKAQTGLPGRVDPPPTPPRATTPPVAPVDGCCGTFSGTYDSSKLIRVTGNVTAVEWVNPMIVLYVDTADGRRWGFTLGSPNRMVGLGMGRTTFKIGDRLSITGYAAAGAGSDCQGQPLPTPCATLPNGALHASATAIAGADGQTIFDRVSTDDAIRRRLLERQAYDELHPASLPSGNR